MKATIMVEKEIEVKTLHVSAGVRYWEDATVNGVEDEDGSLIPCRNGDMWEPLIDVDTGVILNWKQGVVADVHYKVCDDGEYFLHDADGKRVLKYGDYNVPSFFPGEHYGDYLIMQINADGKIADWDSRNIELEDFESLKAEDAG